MGIDMLVNAKGDVATSNFQQHPITTMPSPDHTPVTQGPRSTVDPLDRTGSPHGSIQSVHSRYSTPRPGDMESLSRSYPSPTPMLQSHEPQLAAAMSVHGLPPTSAAQPYQGDYRSAVLPGNWGQTVQPIPARQAVGSQGPVKAFPCNVCRKGFARRSDLARHGRFQAYLCELRESLFLTCHLQRESTQERGHTFAIGLTARSSSFSGRRSPCTTGSILVRSHICVSDAEG